MSFEDRLEQGNAPAWRPDQDHPKTIVGTIVDIDQGQSEYQGAYPILTIAVEDPGKFAIDSGNELAVHGFHSVLRNELIKKKPNIGERIGIIFGGEVETKPGSRFKSYLKYTVKVDRASADFNWDSLGADPDPTDVNPAYAPEPDGLKAPVTVPAGGVVDEDTIPFAPTVF